MEDFAEAYRHVLFDPAKLAAAPEKWVAVAGFETEAAPLPVPPDALDAGARRLLGYSPGPPVDAFFALDVLRGHGAALEPLARTPPASRSAFPRGATSSSTARSGRGYFQFGPVALSRSMMYLLQLSRSSLLVGSLARAVRASRTTFSPCCAAALRSAGVPW